MWQLFMNYPATLGTVVVGGEGGTKVSFNLYFQKTTGILNLNKSNEKEKRLLCVLIGTQCEILLQKTFLNYAHIISPFYP